MFNNARLGTVQLETVPGIARYILSLRFQNSVEKRIMGTCLM